MSAILRFIECQEDTGLYIGYLHSYCKALLRLESDNEIPKAWKHEEKTRLDFTHFITLQHYAKTLSLPLDKPKRPNDLELYFDENHYCDRIWQPLKVATAHVLEAFETAFTEIDGLWSSSTEEQQSRNLFGHTRAQSAIESGKKIAANTNKLFEKDKPTRSELLGVLEEVQKSSQLAAHGMRKMLLPAGNYLETVLDHELAAAMSPDSTWDPAQMVFAASSLVSLDKRLTQDKRVLEAVFHLANVISDRGVFRLVRPFYHEKGGDGMYAVDPAEAITAYAELMRRTPTIGVSPGVVKKMLLFFDDTRARDPGIDKENIDLSKGPHLREYRGWYRHYTAEPRFHPGATVDAVNALAAINKMLDEKINVVILDHFRVKKPEDLSLDLDVLFYPDYGVVSSLKEKIHRPKEVDESEWPDDFRRSESVAVTMQRMRAHVTRVSLDTEAGDTEAGPCCSVAFHGPPGTGKTTLVEALAKSCGVPFVEVTPSDIIVGGEEAVERRARAVFEALTLLTRVVILFDEFDPVLWRRDPENTSPRSVFTFLTPGMLPKLKDLRRCAAKRSCAFVLSTNLIGSLEPAAVREGRFDKKVGIYLR